MTSHKPPYSVLMSVYNKEKPDFLKESMDSIFNQSVKTDNFVLVCDGPLTDELEDIIKSQSLKHGQILKVYRLKKNMGLGKALNYGMKKCKHELIARMDSDDISLPDRIEKQLTIFNGDKSLSICSGTVAEFDTNISEIRCKRTLPKTNEEIISFCKKRNPFNHPCVMYKKSKVLEAGGYKDFYLLEDYYLWIRMLSKGMKGYNTEDTLLYMRAGDNLYKRRSGIKYAKAQIKLLKYMKDKKIISGIECVEYSTARATVSLCPNVLRKLVYGKIRA